MKEKAWEFLIELAIIDLVNWPLSSFPEDNVDLMNSLEVQGYDISSLSIFEFDIETEIILTWHSENIDYYLEELAGGSYHFIVQYKKWDCIFNEYGSLVSLLRKYREWEPVC
jgi:hypothetical protein